MIIKLSKIPFKGAAIAMTVGPFTFVEKGASDEGVIAHEKFHARMFFWWFIPTAVLTAAAWFFGLVGLWTAVPLAFVGVALRAAAYNFVQSYRLWEETRAYGIQAAVNGYSLEKTRSYAKVILDHYAKGGYSQADLTKLEDKLLDELVRNR